MEILRLKPTHASLYRAFMLQAYEAYADAFTSSALERATLPPGWWEARLAGAVDATEIVLGALDGGNLIGVVGLAFKSREKTRHKATLFGMVVHKDHQGNGLGRALVQAALTIARERPGVQLVQLSVTEGNSPATALYRRCGFVEFGVEPMAIALTRGYAAKVHMWCSLNCQPPSSG
jgi:ribosomal protein S18 acetylase RimI-like enzyme